MEAHPSNSMQNTNPNDQTYGFTFKFIEQSEPNTPITTNGEVSEAALQNDAMSNVT